MKTKIITSSEFRKNQRFYFDKSKEDGVVYVLRGSELFSLRPTTELELYYTNPKVREDLTVAKNQIERGEVYEMLPGESLDEFLNRMEAEKNV